MEDVFEKKIKEFLPYIIIIGLVYMLMPGLIVISKGNVVLSQIMYIGIFPITAFGCSFYHSYKKGSDFFMTLVAPVLYIPSMLLYGNLSDSVLNSLIFLVSYFICSYLGLTVGEMLSGNEPKEKEKSKRSVPKNADARTYNREPELFVEEFEPVKSYEESNTNSYNDSYDYESTESDIDAILAELHNRRDI